MTMAVSIDIYIRNGKFKSGPNKKGSDNNTRELWPVFLSCIVNCVRRKICTTNIYNVLIDGQTVTTGIEGMYPFSICYILL
jgi:hypothetical protein